MTGGFQRATALACGWNLVVPSPRPLVWKTHGQVFPYPWGELSGQRLNGSVDKSVAKIEAKAIQKASVSATK